MGGKSKKVLVVDDDSGMLWFYRRLFINTDYEAVCVSSALEALEVIDPSFMAVVTDLDMPKINGVVFVRELRCRGIRIPVLMVSGNLSALKEEFLAVDVQAFFSKPFENKKFLEILGTFTAGTVPQAVESPASIFLPPIH